MPSLYDIDAIYLEPYHPPHRGHRLIHAHLKDHQAGKDDLAITAKRVIEAEDGSALAVEWTISYGPAGVCRIPQGGRTASGRFRDKCPCRDDSR